MIVLVTGATGVVGTEVVRALSRRNIHVVGLSRTPPTTSDDGLIQYVRGDVTLPGLGLDNESRRQVEACDVMIHIAGEVSFTHDKQTYLDINVAGTVNATQLARDLDQRLVYVSTAYSQRALEAGFVARDSGASAYVWSKFLAEDRVRTILPAATVVRPSIVIGRSTDAAIAAWQGLHFFMRNIFRGRFSFIPAEATWLLDTVPVDHLASFIVEAMSDVYNGQALWATVGEEALDVEQVARLALPDDAELPRFVHPEIFDRLIRPAFLDEVPADVAKYVLSVIDISDQLFTETPFSSDLSRVTSIHWQKQDSYRLVAATGQQVRQTKRHVGSSA